jgi:hypothetical protein
LFTKIGLIEENSIEAQQPPAKKQPQFKYALFANSLILFTATYLSKDQQWTEPNCMPIAINNFLKTKTTQRQAFCSSIFIFLKNLQHKYDYFFNARMQL